MKRAALGQILEHVRAEPSRTWSIIVTVFGDAIVPRGGSVWLGTLLVVFKAMGISEGVVRTAVSRLATDGWLERSRVGRNSFYRLADKGRDTFRQAAAQIYRPKPPPWHGHFEMVLLDDPAPRAQLRAEGWGAPAPGIWLRAAGSGAAPLPEGALRLEACGDDGANRALAARAWPLDETGAAYQRFVRAFSPLREALAGEADLSDLDALVARVLLIHEYRRIVLRDPILPAEILPEPWPGHAARAVCAEVYRRLLEPSERWLDANAIDETGKPLSANPELSDRFAS